MAFQDCIIWTLYLPTYLPTFLPACPPASLPVCLPTCLPAYLPTYLPTCLRAYQPACLPTCLPSCLPTQAARQILAPRDRLEYQTPPPSHFPSSQVFKFSSFQVFKFLTFQVFTFPCFQVFRLSSFQVSKRHLVTLTSQPLATLNYSLPHPFNFISIKHHYSGGGLEGGGGWNPSKSIGIPWFLEGVRGGAVRDRLRQGNRGHVQISMFFRGNDFAKPVSIKRYKNRHENKKISSKPIVCSRENSTSLKNQ